MNSSGWYSNAQHEYICSPTVVIRYRLLPAVRGGKPHLAGTRIAVDDVVLMHYRLGQSLEEIAGKYDLSLAAVFSAMAYYYDHRDEVDRRIQEDQAFVEAFRRANASPLQEKLRALGCV